VLSVNTHTSVYTHMKPYSLIHCYLTSAEDSVQEQMWLYIQRYKGWISTHPLGLLVYIPERYSAIILMLDPLAQRQHRHDYIA
jgi:hypothetical protein